MFLSQYTVAYSLTFSASRRFECSRFDHPFQGSAGRRLGMCGAAGGRASFGTSGVPNYRASHACRQLKIHRGPQTNLKYIQLSLYKKRRLEHSCFLNQHQDQKAISRATKPIEPCLIGMQTPGCLIPSLRMTQEDRSMAGGRCSKQLCSPVLYINSFFLYEQILEY